MPKRTDLRKILIIGAGPIIIGQACEFDYSGTQACKALQEEGYEVILVNSNPATIMTDPSFADKTYIEPINVESIEKILDKEKPDAILPTMGGQTSLNVTVELSKAGILDKHNIELIGAKFEAIDVAEDRDKFKQLVEEAGLKSAKSEVVTNIEEGRDAARTIGFPLILRPAFTLGGYGGGIVYNSEEYEELLAKGLKASPVSQVLVEQSVLGWKEYEYEVMRDLNDNVVIICTIENFDPMGTHTGDSITVAPAQTLSDKEYQELRDASLKIIRAVGVETGGSNIQFAVNPENGEFIVIEMNPRVSRSSALASKATGFPIAKIAAKLAIGYTLDEIDNAITQKTKSSFEPSIDYVVTKVPRFAFEKFQGAADELGPQMKSVGETMALGRSFKESFQKALRGLENRGSLGFINPDLVSSKLELDQLKARQTKARKAIATPSSHRCIDLFDAFYCGLTLEEVYEITKIDPWFLAHLYEIVEQTQKLQDKAQLASSLDFITAKELKKLKSSGFSDKQIAIIISTKTNQVTEEDIRALRTKLDVIPVYKTVDTCAGEFESYTPYHYSSYDLENEVQSSDKEKVFILGGGPNRIGQGIEFDYCCVHAAQILAEAGYETIMINNNPETVSTDYDTSDRLYFEPVTIEDVLAIYNQESQNGAKIKGAIVQLGGQTPLNISQALEDNGVKIIGTLPSQIDLAEDRDLFGKLIKDLGLKQTENGIANSMDETKAIAQKIGYPVVTRPSYVLGGRGMDIIYSDTELEAWFNRTILEDSQFPVLIDKYLIRATEIDVDAVADPSGACQIAGIMEHIEYAGIHSGDSASVYPPQNLSEAVIAEIKAATHKLAKALKVNGLMNIQFALKGSDLYILEVNPRASRTVPFISKATGIPWAKMASLIMAGQTIEELGIAEMVKNIPQDQISVKEAVFSFNKFSGTNIFLGPEMKSTGEVMGISDNFAKAFAKAQQGASLDLPIEGNVFISFGDSDKPDSEAIAIGLKELGFNVYATSGTAKFLASKGVEVNAVKKVSEGRPNISDMIKNDDIQLIFNVPDTREALEDSHVINNVAMTHDVPVITTNTGAQATVNSLEAVINHSTKVKTIQEYQEKSMQAA